MGRVVRKHEPLLPDKAGPTPAIDRCLSRPDDELQWFRSCLRSMFMDQSDSGHAFVSWLLFLLLGIAVPAGSHFVLSFRPQRRPYDASVQVSLSAVSGASFLCLSTVLRRYVTFVFLSISSYFLLVLSILVLGYIYIYARRSSSAFMD